VNYCFRYILLLILVLHACPLYAQEDMTEEDPDEVNKPRQFLFEQLPRQLRFSMDISKPVSAALLGNRSGYELMVDYHFRKDLYAVVEGGWGSSNYQYPDLSYKSANGFMRIGVDKNMMQRLSLADWDMVFAGLRYGMSVIHRGEGRYTTVDSLWGQTAGTIDARTFTGHWLELTGGMRVEIVRNIFLGWTVRGRFLLNRSSFEELPPFYVAGYGRGDKNAIFDFNFYLSYALRWNKSAAAPYDPVIPVGNAPAK
jgi:hypothetical protein